MPSLSDITLPKGKIVVTLTTSSIQVETKDNALNFGYVQKINDLCDTVTVGQEILFNPSLATQFTIISGTIYYLVDENQIGFINEYIAP